MSHREGHLAAASRPQRTHVTLLLALGLASLASPAFGDSAIPVVYAFTPHQGSPGTVVKIAGDNFDAVVSIEFPGGVLTDFRLFSSSMLKVTVPDGAGSGPILLRSANGGAWTPDAFQVITPPPGGLALAAPYPNPGPGPFRLRFNLPAERRFELDVVDPAGRRVRRLAGGTAAAGPHETAWDGLDTAGRRAPPGLYLVRLRIDKGVLARRLLLID
jgi:FlgD Ig-like domain/IPT/TIG domain